MYITILCISAVAICTERVEANLVLCGPVILAVLVAICTERVEANDAVGIDRNAGGVAICTERVEANLLIPFRRK